jgi:hypothetical protein
MPCGQGSAEFAYMLLRIELHADLPDQFLLHFEEVDVLFLIAASAIFVPMTLMPEW